MKNECVEVLDEERRSPQPMKTNKVRDTYKRRCMFGNERGINRASGGKYKGGHVAPCGFRKCVGVLGEIRKG